MLKIKSDNERETMPKHSKKPELSNKRAVKTLIFRQFGLLNNNDKRQIPHLPPCFVDKNAVHGKNLGKHIVFRGFLLFFGQKWDVRAPSKQVSILCCLLTVFNTVREQYEHAFCGIFLAPCRSSSLQYLGIAASSSRQLIPKFCRKKCKAIKSS